MEEVTRQALYPAGEIMPGDSFVYNGTVHTVESLQYDGTTTTFEFDNGETAVYHPDTCVLTDMTDWFAEQKRLILSDYQCSDRESQQLAALLDKVTAEQALAYGSIKLVTETATRRITTPSSTPETLVVTQQSSNSHYYYLSVGIALLGGLVYFFAQR